MPTGIYIRTKSAWNKDKKTGPNLNISKAMIILVNGVKKEVKD